MVLSGNTLQGLAKHATFFAVPVDLVVDTNGADVDAALAAGARKAARALSTLHLSPLLDPSLSARAGDVGRVRRLREGPSTDR